MIQPSFILKSVRRGLRQFCGLVMDRGDARSAERQARHASSPPGRKRIAHRFIGAVGEGLGQVPSGTKDHVSRWPRFLPSLSGLVAFDVTCPALKRRAVFFRPARPALALALLSCLLAATFAAEPAANLRQAKLRLLFANSLIQNVNRNDILAAFKLWVETVGRNRGFLLEAEPESFDRLEEVEKRLRERTLDLVILPTTDYLQLAANGPLQPVFSPARSQKIPFDDYVLVTRRDRNFPDLPALRGKSVAFYQYGGNQARRWMEVALGESGLGSVNDFFGAKSDFTKASAVVLPVFFGKLDAAVVNRSSLDTMKEMNPQLAAQLEVLTNSCRLPESVICLHQDYTEVRADVLAGLAELHTEPRGQQILLVFKIAKLMPFQPEYLDFARDLQARQRKLATRAEAQTAGTTVGGEPKP